MNNLYTYSVQDLNKLLDENGIELTWQSILKTLIVSLDSKFSYILNDEFFESAKVLETNYIEGLSVGEIGVLYEYSLAYVNPESRKESGQYFTPDDFANFMSSYAAEFPLGVWLDPCSGVGNLSYWLIKNSSEPEKFLSNNIILTDKDSLALKIARTILTLAFQKDNHNLYFDISDKFITLDFLKDEIPTFDYSILNPPYLSVKAYEDFETSSCGDLFVYFLEKIIKNSKGFISITPQTFTNGKKYQPLRKLLLDNFEGLRILCFDNVPDNVFKGIKFGSKNSNTANSTRAAIIVAQKTGDRQITSLLRWKSEERERFILKAKRFLCDANLSEEIFPKVHCKLLFYFQKVSRYKTLDLLLSKKETSFVLYVPNTPRYFLSATKTFLNRTGMRKLYFRSQSDLDYAYILLNSSFSYWWWRVMDGGMSISDTTIKTMPLPKFIVDKDIVKEIEHSETVNKVGKLNAGTINENVKHLPELVMKLNTHISPSYAKKLYDTHRNSVL
jgi:hypothetical protein